MQRISIKPTNEQHWLELRTNDITSTEISALFGLSPYMTYYELWHLKDKKQIVTLDENERMTWGKLMEPIIAKQACTINGWAKPELIENYARIPELRLGSSFDYKTYTAPDQKAILEVKNVDSWIFKKDWPEKTDYTREAPPHIELQAQHQLLISGASELYICALVGGNELHVLKRERNEKVIAAIISESKKFWESIDRGDTPAPNFEADSEFIIKLYSDARPDSYLETEDKHLECLANDYKEISAEIKHLEITKNSKKAEILYTIGEYETVEGSGFRIKAKVDKRGNRRFTVTIKDKNND